MSFGSEQFNQQFIEEKEEKEPFPLEKDLFFKEKQGFNKEKSAFSQNEVFPNRKKEEKFAESETESQKKESSLQNSKLKDQIVKNITFIKFKYLQIKAENPWANRKRKGFKGKYQEFSPGFNYSQTHKT